MSQWSTLASLCCKNVKIQERINELYRRIHFPYKFRSLYCKWIEARDWSSIDTKTDAGLKQAEQLFKELMVLIEGTENDMKKDNGFDLEKSLDFQRAKEFFQKSFEGNYGTFVEILSNCMKEERMLIESSVTDNNELKRKTRLPPKPQNGAEIETMAGTLRQQIALVENAVQNMSINQDAFQINLQQLNQRIDCIETQLRSPQSEQTRGEYLGKKAALEREKKKGILDNFECRTSVANNLVKLAKLLEQLLIAVWKEIEKWQDGEKRCITALVTPVAGMIETLEKMCQDVGQLFLQLVWQMKDAVTVFKKLPYHDDKKLEELSEVLNDLQHRCLDTHLAHIFIVDNNIPDRVLKVSSGKSSPFNTSVRILGGKSLGLGCPTPTVNMSIFQEKEIPPGSTHVDGVFPIMNASGRPMDVNRGTDALVAHFTSVVLKNVKRPDRGKNEELVTELKYAFVFYTSVKVLEREIPLRVISLPVILTSQTSQEIMAKGTLIWDAAFSEQDRKPFECREKVRWAELAEVLNALFLRNTGRELTQEHLNYLAKLALRIRKNAESYDERFVSSKQIIRDRMSSRCEFSFWKWFWANMNLVKNHVKAEWQDGLIYGFISKDDAKQLMIDCQCGTFLLRFSESNIETSQRTNVSGCLTLAFVEIDPETGQKKLFHVKEYLSPKDLSQRKLAPVLEAMEVADYSKSPKIKKKLLRYLYPDCSTTFETRFAEHLKSRDAKPDTELGYTPGKYNIEIYLTNDQQNASASETASCASTSCPPTPQDGASMMSPLYEGTENMYSAAFVGYNVGQVSSPSQRQTASVKPQGQFCTLDLSQLPENGGMVMVNTEQYQQLLMQQQQQQHWSLASDAQQNYVIQDDIDSNATLFGDLSFNDPSLQSMTPLVNCSPDQVLVLDEDGDLVIRDSSAVDGGTKFEVPVTLG